MENPPLEMVYFDLRNNHLKTERYNADLPDELYQVATLEQALWCKKGTLLI